MVKQLVIVSGMSGAGKSTAMSILEDLGYHCMDQFPKELMDQLVCLFKKTVDPQYANVALSTSIEDLPDIYNAFHDNGFNFRMLLLTAADEELVVRYKFTRHMHPLMVQNQAGSLSAAIAKERKLYNDLPQYDNARYLDTGDLTYNDLKKQMDTEFSLTVGHDLSITFESFGYKYGIPQDADFLFDVRVLPNPYWVEDLRKYSGDDQPVYDYVINSPAAKEYLSRLTNFLDLLFEMSAKKGRGHILIGIGCTGGRHRSVSVVNYLMKVYSPRYSCFKEYRLRKPGE